MKNLTTDNAFVRDIVSAARANFLPALGLQSVALFLLWSYHFWPQARRTLEHLAQLKHDSGFVFAIVTSALAGAILPLCLQRLQRGDHRRVATAALPILLLFWGLRGCMVDVFYRVQTALWGDNAQPLTLAIKILVDLGIYTPILGVPSAVLIFAWLDNRGRNTKFRAPSRGEFLTWYRRDVWPLMRMAWVVWLPALVVIYALPQGLQYPTSIIIQCFWALILVVLTDKGQTVSSAAQI